MVDVIEDEDRCVLRVVPVIRLRVVERHVERDSNEISVSWIIGSLLIPALLLAFVQYISHIPVEEYTGAGDDSSIRYRRIHAWYSIVMPICSIYIHSVKKKLKTESWKEAWKKKFKINLQPYPLNFIAWCRMYVPDWISRKENKIQQAQGH